MKTDLSVAELLALFEIAGGQTGGSLPAADPPRLLQDIQQRLDLIIIRYRKERELMARLSKKTAAARKSSK
jgi:hypothetical protein